MSDMSDADFASYVDRIMACRDAEDAAKADTKLVYAAAADAGLDKTALGVFVRIERMDAKQVVKANRKDELTEEYRARYRRGKASHVRVREAAAFSTAPNPSVSEAFDPETGEFSTPPEINEPRNPAPQESASDLTVPQALTGQVATHTLETADENGPEAGAATSIASEAIVQGGIPVRPGVGLVDLTVGGDESGTAATPSADVSQEHAQTATGIGASGDNLGSGSRPIATAKTDVPSDQGQASGDGQSQDSSGVRVTSVDTPFYAEPGIVTREQNGREPMVAHPYATCWPVNTIDVSDGVQKPIVKIGGLILDGRGRYLAARKVHTSPNSTLEYPTVQYDGDDDLADSIRWNLESRPNMSEAALRIVAQKLAKLAPERGDEILERMGLAQVSEAAE